MKCPNCNETLVMADRQGVEIDYCPSCRGVWLDKGELDKIIERAAEFENRSTPPQQQGSPQQQPYTQQPYGQQPYHQKDPYYDPHYKYKKKKGFLGEFFDFD